MDSKYNSQFMDWLYKKYQAGTLDMNTGNLTVSGDEWFENEYIEYKKYHPYAVVFVKNLSMDEFVNEINKLKNKSK